MIKRVVVLVVTFAVLLGTSVGWAEDTLYQKAKDVAYLYNDCAYLLQTSDISYEKFDEMYTKATIAKNRFMMDNKDIPVELKQSLQCTDSTFSLTKKIWGYKLNTSKVSSGNGTIDDWIKKYPKLERSRTGELFEGNVEYSTSVMLKIFKDYCVEYSKNLIDLINNESQQ